MTDHVTLHNTYKSIDVSARLSRWDALAPGFSTTGQVGQEFWLGVATQAMVAAMYQHHHCPTGSIYIQKQPTVKVVVVSVPTRKFVMTPYPSVVKKVVKDTSHIHLTIGATPPVDFNIEKPDMNLLLIMEFWRMRRAPAKENATMVISMVEVVCPLPAIMGLPKSVTVRVPSAVPCKKIKAGDELVLHVPARQKVENTEKLLPVMQEPAQKKPRTVE